ncbi:hypothetical protein CASFOL_037604 [Castilleja foliolosa]|uniref:DUF547 domain-containing protein n=1 Tax=Castilleja foliolosa TaxID=1961234 RepID=A0ABD3BML3_9LAMI
MTSHPQHKKLAKYQFELKSSSSSSSKSSSFNSASSSIHLPTPIIRIEGVSLNDYKTHHRHHHRHHFTRPWEKLKHTFVSFSHMACHNDKSSSLDQYPIEFRKKMVNGQKKEELEREVSVLMKMLAHEQKVHQYLDQLHHRNDGSALTVPSFLPPNMKEIATELALIEKEITHLESQIKQLKSQVKHEKEVNMESKYKEWGRRSGTSLRSRLESSPLPPHPNRKPNEKVTFETKALHFISKAIKGDYHSISPIEKATSHKENAAFQEEGGGIFREKVIKRSGVLKSPSPLKERRHPTPRRDRSLEVNTEAPPPKVLSTPLHSEEENIHRWPPNKLSENIIKCLAFIYVRLLRTSRVMELEKSGPIARSINFSLSFRSETSLAFHKDSRQQDPYGIFDSEESIPRDIGPYKNLIRFTSSSMDMKCIQNSSSIPLFQRLKLLMDGLQKVDLRFLSHQQKLAFWINMYNACIMHGYLQYGANSVSSPDNTLALINKATLNIAGNTINAQAIEHFILRKPEEKLVKEIIGKDERDAKQMMVNELYGLESPDPNITFALCCGTRSSPAVKIYTADGVIAELEKSRLDYLQAAIMVTSSKRIAIPELLLRNINDFAADKESLIEWICQQLPTSCSLRKSIVDCFKGLHGVKASAVVEKIAYEFEFQYLLAM